MSRLFLLLAFALLALFVASTAGETDINFYFANMLAGANGGAAYSGSEGPSVSAGNDLANEDQDAFAIEQTINSFFSVNDVASNDPPANVVYSKYAPYIQNLVSSNIVLSTTSSIVNNGQPTTYNGVQGVVNYLHDIALTRNSSHQELTNLIYNFNGADNCNSADAVTVNAVYSGIESLNSNFSYQTFYGQRTYNLVRSASSTYGWAITSVNIVRYVTVPSPDYTGVFTARAQAAVLHVFDFNDLASNDAASNVNDANYDSLVAPYLTSGFYVYTFQPATGNRTYGVAGSDNVAPGPSAYVAYLNALSSARSSSQSGLSSFEFNFNADQSSVVVLAKVTGFEVNTSNQADIFFGTRRYTVDRQTNGTWLVSSLTAVRTGSFAQ